VGAAPMQHRSCPKCQALHFAQLHHMSRVCVVGMGFVARRHVRNDYQNKSRRQLDTVADHKHMYLACRTIQCQCQSATWV
jgi:hypothetical protein